jgi:hypothetical protein
MTSLMRALIIAMFAMSVGCDGRDSDGGGSTTPTGPTGSNFIPNTLAQNLHIIDSGLNQEGDDMRVELRDPPSGVKPPYSWAANGMVLKFNASHQALLGELPAGNYTITVLTSDGRTGITKAPFVINNRTIYKSVDLPTHRAITSLLPQRNGLRSLCWGELAQCKSQ